MTPGIGRDISWDQIISPLNRPRTFAEAPACLPQVPTPRRPDLGGPASFVTWREVRPCSSMVWRPPKARMWRKDTPKEPSGCCKPGSLRLESGQLCSDSGEAESILPKPFSQQGSLCPEEATSTPVCDLGLEAGRRHAGRDPVPVAQTAQCREPWGGCDFPPVNQRRRRCAQSGGLRPQGAQGPWVHGPPGQSS